MRLHRHRVGDARRWGASLPAISASRTDAGGACFRDGRLQGLRALFAIGSHTYRGTAAPRAAARPEAPGLAGRRIALTDRLAPERTSPTATTRSSERLFVSSMHGWCGGLEKRPSTPVDRPQ